MPIQYRAVPLRLLRDAQHVVPYLRDEPVEVARRMPHVQLDRRLERLAQMEALAAATERPGTT